MEIFREVNDGGFDIFILFGVEGWSTRFEKVVFQVDGWSGFYCTHYLARQLVPSLWVVCTSIIQKEGNMQSFIPLIQLAFHYQKQVCFMNKHVNPMLSDFWTPASCTLFLLQLYFHVTCHQFWKCFFNLEETLFTGVKYGCKKVKISPG